MQRLISDFPNVFTIIVTDAILRATAAATAFILGTHTTAAHDVSVGVLDWTIAVIAVSMCARLACARIVADLGASIRLGRRLLDQRED